MSAFKTYVIKEQVGSFVVEREIEIALKSELEAERSSSSVKLNDGISTSKLLESLSINKLGLADDLKVIAKQHNAQIFQPTVKHKIARVFSLIRYLFTRLRIKLSNLMGIYRFNKNQLKLLKQFKKQYTVFHDGNLINWLHLEDQILNNTNLKLFGKAPDLAFKLGYTSEGRGCITRNLNSSVSEQSLLFESTSEFLEWKASFSLPIGESK